MRNVGWKVRLPVPKLWNIQFIFSYYCIQYARTGTWEFPSHKLTWDQASTKIKRYGSMVTKFWISKRNDVVLASSPPAESMSWTEICERWKWYHYDMAREWNISVHEARFYLDVWSVHFVEKFRDKYFMGGIVGRHYLSLWVYETSEAPVTCHSDGDCILMVVNSCLQNRVRFPNGYSVVVTLGILLWLWCM